MSTIKVTNVNPPTAGQAVNINGLAYPTAGPLSNRNKIINGDMRIDQRNGGSSVTITTTAGGQYTLDRWFGQASQSSKFSVQRNAGSVTPPTGFANYLGVTSSSAYSVTSGDYFSIKQSIEGFNGADLAFGTANASTVTISFRVYSSLTGTFGAVLQNGTYNRSYPFTYTISSANTWTTVSVTIPGDTSGTWETGNSGGLVVIFGLGVGSTYSGTAGSWSGNNYISATGATSVVGTNGATFYITGVQLEAGSVATPFEHRPYGTELALCQRYYSQSFSASSGFPSAPDYNGAMGWGQSVEAAAVQVSVRFPVEMRANPTITIYSPTSLTAGTFRVWQAGVDRNGTAGHISSSGFARIDKSGAADLSPTAVQNSAIQWIATVEL